MSDHPESDDTLVVVSDYEGLILAVPCNTNEEATELLKWFCELLGTLSPKPDWVLYTTPLEVVENPNDREKMAELFFDAARREGYTP